MRFQSSGRSERINRTQQSCSESSIDSETYPSDILGPHYHESDLLVTPLSLGPEGARVPDGPGLGVALDEAALARYRCD